MHSLNVFCVQYRPSLAEIVWFFRENGVNWQRFRSRSGFPAGHAAAGPRFGRAGKLIAYAVVALGYNAANLNAGQ